MCASSQQRAPEAVPGAPVQTSLASGSQVCPTSSQGALSPATTTPAKLSNIVSVASKERVWKGSGRDSGSGNSRGKGPEWEGAQSAGETRRSRAGQGGGPGTAVPLGTGLQWAKELPGGMQAMAGGPSSLLPPKQLAKGAAEVLRPSLPAAWGVEVFSQVQGTQQLFQRLLLPSTGQALSRGRGGSGLEVHCAAAAEPTPRDKLFPRDPASQRCRASQFRASWGRAEGLHPEQPPRLPGTAGGQLSVSQDSTLAPGLCLSRTSPCCPHRALLPSAWEGVSKAGGRHGPAKIHGCVHTFMPSAPGSVAWPCSPARQPRPHWASKSQGSKKGGGAERESVPWPP